MNNEILPTANGKVLRNPLFHFLPYIIPKTNQYFYFIFHQFSYSAYYSNGTFQFRIESFHQWCPYGIFSTKTVTYIIKFQSINVKAFCIWLKRVSQCLYIKTNRWCNCSKKSDVGIKRIMEFIRSTDDELFNFWYIIRSSLAWTCLLKCKISRSLYYFEEKRLTLWTKNIIAILTKVNWNVPCNRIYCTIKRRKKYLCTVMTDFGKTTKNIWVV